MQVQKNCTKVGFEPQACSKIRTLTRKESSTDLINKKKRVDHSRCRVRNANSTEEDKEEHF